MKKNFKSAGMIAKLLCGVLILGAFIYGISNLDKGSTEAHRKQLEDSIRHACVVCYATEGQYPPNLAYLQEHYGIRTDTPGYTVFYDIFAENLMPEITVVSAS